MAIATLPPGPSKAASGPRKSPARDGTPAPQTHPPFAGQYPAPHRNHRYFGAFFRPPMLLQPLVNYSFR